MKEKKKVCACKGKMCTATCGSCQAISELYTSPGWEGVGKCWKHGNYVHASDEACDDYY